MVSEKEKPPYQCVEIIANDGACAAARALRNRLILSDDAPVLPLSACDHPSTCNCAYRQFDDRRHSPRRESDQ